MNNKQKDYKIKDGKILRFEPLESPRDALQALADNAGEPVDGFAFRDSKDKTWELDTLIGYDGNEYYPYNGEETDYTYYARVTIEDPRQRPVFAPPLPSRTAAYVRRHHSQLPDGNYWCLQTNNTWYWANYQPSCAGGDGYHFVVDCATEFARREFPEYVEALGLPLGINEDVEVDLGYGFQPNGEPVPTPPEGWEIVPEFTTLPEPCMFWSIRLGWHRTGRDNNRVSECSGTIRAYARKVETSPPLKPLDPGDIRKGQTITVLRWKKREDRTYIGSEMKVMAVQLPFVKVQHDSWVQSGNVVTLDTREIDVAELSEEFCDFK